MDAQGWPECNTEAQEILLELVIKKAIPTRVIELTFLERAKLIALGAEPGYAELGFREAVIAYFSEQSK